MRLKVGLTIFILPIRKLRNHIIASLSVRKKVVFKLRCFSMGAHASECLEKKQWEDIKDWCLRDEKRYLHNEQKYDILSGNVRKEFKHKFDVRGTRDLQAYSNLYHTATNEDKMTWAQDSAMTENQEKEDDPRDVNDVDGYRHCIVKNDPCRATNRCC